MTKTTKRPTLDLFLIARVQGSLDAAIEHIGPRDAADYWDRRTTGLAALVHVLERDVQARITRTHDANRISIAGVTSTCTHGLDGCVRNWLASARKKVAA